MSASPAQTVEGKAAGKRSPLVLILIIVIVLLAVGGGGAAYYFYKQASAHAGRPVTPPPVFYALDPFTVNLSGDDNDSDGSDSHYLHVGLTLKIPNAETQHQLAEYLPEIRSRILLLISSRKPSDLATVAGKNKLAEDIRASIQKPFVKDENSIKIDSVLLTDFVIQ